MGKGTLAVNLAQVFGEGAEVLLVEVEKFLCQRKQMAQATNIIHTHSVSAATQEQSASMEEIASSCQGLPQSLQHAVSKFRESAYLPN